MIQGLLFDMDGLLLDTERAGMAAFRGIALRFGVEADAADAFYVSLVGSNEAHTKDRVAEFLPRADVEEIGQEWRSSVDQIMDATVPLRPTVADTLTSLATRAIPMSVVTSTHTDRARSHLHHAGLLAHFHDVIGGDQVPAPKPDPSPYVMGAATLGLPPAACAAFEDSDTGTRAALAAGCHVWQIPDLRPANTPLPVLGQRVATTLAEAVFAAGF